MILTFKIFARVGDVRFIHVKENTNERIYLEIIDLQNDNFY